MLQSLKRQALALAIVLSMFVPVLADELDDQYLRLLTAVDQAEALEQAGKTDAAKARYQTIQKALLEIKKADPTWKANMVAHRLKEIDGKLAALSAGSAKAIASPGGSSRNSTGEAQPAASVVKLLNPGSEPRQAVRLQTKVGEKQKLELVMNIGMEMSMAGNPMPKMEMPVMKLPMEVTVESVSSGGDIAYASVLGEVVIEPTGQEMPGVVDAMRATLSGTKGLSTSGIMSGRGVQKSVELKLPPDTAPQARQAMDQMKDALAGVAMPFPEEPIGVGAKWEAKQVLKSQGMTIKQTANCELVSLTGNRAEVKVMLQQSAANQKIASPAMPGMKVDLDKYEGTGTGKSVYDLTRPMPVSAEMNSQADVAMAMDMGGQKQSMGMKTMMKMRLESK